MHTFRVLFPQFAEISHHKSFYNLATHISTICFCILDIPKFFRWDRKPTKNGKYKFETLKVDQCSGSSVLEINNAAVGDSGVYLCFISNRRGYVVVSTRVTVKGKKVS